MAKRGFNLKIIHRHHGSCDEGLMDRLQEVNESYESRIAALKSFSKSSKHKHKADTHKTEWMEEHHRLNSMQFKLLQSIDESWSHVIACTPDDASDVYSLLGTQQESKAEISSLCKMMQKQLDELKQLIHQAKRGGHQEDSSLASAVVADVLVQFRNNHSNHWAELHKEELSLRATVAAAAKAIMRMIHEDSMQQQERAFNDELLAILQEEAGGDVCDMDGEVAEMIHTWYEKLSELDLRYAAEMAAKAQERAAFCQEIDVDNTPYKGWEADEHDAFCKIYKKAQISGMKRRTMMDLLVAQLPARSMDDILAHEEWFRKMKTIQVKYKDSEELYKTSRQDLMSEARAAIKAYFVDQRTAAENDRLMEEHERKRSELHKRLFALREQKEADLMLQLEELRSKHNELAAVREEESKLLAVERQHKKELVNSYQLQQQVLLEEQRKLQAEQEEAAAKAMKELVEKNRSKVEFRTQKIQEKQQQKKLLEVRCAFINVSVGLLTFNAGGSVETRGEAP